VVGLIVLVAAYFGGKFALKKWKSSPKRQEIIAESDFLKKDIAPQNIPKKVYTIEFDVKGLSGMDVLDVYVGEDKPYVVGKVLIQDEWETIRFLTNEEPSKYLVIKLRTHMPGTRILLKDSIVVNDKECFDPSIIRLGDGVELNEENEIMGAGACRIDVYQKLD